MRGSGILDSLICNEVCFFQKSTGTVFFFRLAAGSGQFLCIFPGVICIYGSIIIGINFTLIFTGPGLTVSLLRGVITPSVTNPHLVNIPCFLIHLPGDRFFDIELKYPTEDEYSSTNIPLVTDS